MKSPRPLVRRNLWPIAIVIYFIFFAAFIISFTVFAMRQKTDLITSNYYEDEILFQKQIDASNRTNPLRNQISVGYNAEQHQIVISLPPGHRDAAGSVRLYRPSDVAADLKLNLALDLSASQSIDARQLRSGLWRVRLQWRINGEEYFIDQSILVAPET